ncbi:hypothetical protein FBEOM_7952 [Fusarium beomiforme]|uniref:Uncharacterized protein n=1 Tax=Fusarium beomiforme TaxID=44412 RepID=A0A9P5AG27_9HYPO|nr:hypothetical protein FBEOM_7952 [Fusarium beomiforme]
MARLHDLPAELVVATMKYFDTPQDILAVIQADPWALLCFLGNRRQVLEKHLTNLLNAYGGHLSIAVVLAARLRHAKQDPAFNSHKPQHRERILSPIILSHVNRADVRHRLSYQASLATICALLNLAPDVEWMTTSYAAQAWNRMTQHSSYRRNQRQISDKERQKLINAACRFESYIQAFFHHEEPLFPRDLSIRRLLFAPSLSNVEKECKTIQTFYSTVYYIYDQHWSMLNNVASYLRTRQSCSICSRAQASTDPQKERQQLRLQNCTQLNMNKYVHYLTSQGLGMFLHLQSMDLEDQLRFVLSTFEDILDNRHPTTLIVHGINLHKIGTIEKHSWNPWVLCENAFEMEPGQWRWAASFWDSHRRGLHPLY